MEDNRDRVKRESTIICPPPSLHILLIPRTLVKRPKSSVGSLEESFLENLTSPRRT